MFCRITEKKTVKDIKYEHNFTRKIAEGKSETMNKK